MVSLLDELDCLAITEGMPANAIESLARIGVWTSYPAGRVLFHEYDQHRSLHVLCGGTVALEMRVPGHGTQRILSLGRGDLLAWSSILSSGVMTTSAIAMNDVESIDFDAKALLELCERDHEVGYHFMKQVAVALSKRLLATRLQLLDLFRD
jgi:CRP-like cAMP-binding protein